MLNGPSPPPSSNFFPAHPTPTHENTQARQDFSTAICFVVSEAGHPCPNSCLSAESVSVGRHDLLATVVASTATSSAVPGWLKSSLSHLSISYGGRSAGARLLFLFNSSAFSARISAFLLGFSPPPPLGFCRKMLILQFIAFI